MNLSSTQAASVDSATKLVGALFPALAAIIAALGFASGDLQRVYRYYQIPAIVVVCVLALAVILAIAAAAISAEDNQWSAISTLALAVVLFVCASVIFVVMALLAALSPDSPSVALKYNEDGSSVTVEVAAARLRGRDLLNVRVTAIPRAGDCEPQVVYDALLGQDKDGNVDYQFHLPIASKDVAVIEAKALIQHGQKTKRTAVARLSFHEGIFMPSGELASGSHPTTGAAAETQPLPPPICSS